MKQENRGGARPNSGPKPQTLSARQILIMLRKAKKRAKAEGKGVDDILLDHVYNPDDKNLSLQAIKVWKQYTMAAPSEGGEADKALAPKIYTPAKYPDSTDAPEYRASH